MKFIWQLFGRLGVSSSRVIEMQPGDAYDLTIHVEGEKEPRTVGRLIALPDHLLSTRPDRDRSSQRTN